MAEVNRGKMLSMTGLHLKATLFVVGNLTVGKQLFEQNHGQYGGPLRFRCQRGPPKCPPRFPLEIVMRRILPTELALRGLLIALAAIAPMAFPAAQAGYSTLRDLAYLAIIPAAILLLLAWSLLRRSPTRLAGLIRDGAIAGALAMVALEAVRYSGFRMGFMPGNLPELMGVLLFDRFALGPTPASTLAGFAYHFWNGACFGVIVAPTVLAAHLAFGAALALLLSKDWTVVSARCRSCGTLTSSTNPHNPAVRKRRYDRYGHPCDQCVIKTSSQSVPFGSVLPTRTPRRKRPQVQPQFVPHTPEHGQPLLFRALRAGRVLEGVMQPVRMARIDRAAFLRVVADGEHVIETLAREFIHRLRLDRCPEISMPSSFMTAIASGRTWPGFVPALSTSKRSQASCRNRPSAIWLLAELRVHRMRTLFLSAVRHLLLPMWDEDVRGLLRQRRHEPAE